LETRNLKLMFNYEKQSGPGIFREFANPIENQEAETMIALIVRFKSQLSYEEVLKMAEDRADRFRALDGLVQKYYLNYAEKDEYGAVYLWESEEALKKFRDSELARSIPEAYKAEGAPDILPGEVIMTLRPEAK
jgi:heme-degrading monooxygenase HmoA